MRALLIAAAAAGLAVAGCGAGGSAPATLETGGPGQLAAAACPEEAPARSPLNKVNDSLDGVVGAIYNNTGGPVLVGFSDEGSTAFASEDDVCELGSGKRVAVAGYVLRFLIKGVGSNAGKTLIAANDNASWWPTVSVTTHRIRKPQETCDGKASPGLSEEQDWTVDDADLGSVRVVRHEDDGDIAKAWTGRDSWTVTDWARIDFEISRLGEGC